MSFYVRRFVAQLVERSLPIPAICGSNLVIGNIIYYQLYWKDENYEKYFHAPLYIY